MDCRSHAAHGDVMKSLLEARAIELAGRLSPTDLSCSAGEVIAVIGPNGAGKTSLLRTIAGIELSAGYVQISGEEISRTPPARRMRLLSFLPATRSLIWPIAARDVIELGLPSSDPPRVEELMGMLELQSLAARPVNQLSTGERSRVLLARALAARPKVLLLDEPLSNLDPYWVLKTLEILRAEAMANESAILASVHDLNQMAAFDRVILLSTGRIAADCEPAEMATSAVLEEAFRIEKSATGWRIRENA
jgi:iron complex transport system ATP-binding protein